MTHQCIIIDDERPARGLIETYLTDLSDFDVVKTFDNAVEGFVYLQNHSIDLLFLDIEMPKMSGLELLKALHTRPKVILTTAYREYAAEGFDLDVLDYLVKPISQKRFLKAISKYLHYQEVTKEVAKPDPVEPAFFDDAYIFLKVEKEQVKVFLNDILYIEGLKDYIKVFTTKGRHIVHGRLGYMEAKLPESKFARVHKSFIVAIDKVSVYGQEALKIQQQEIPIGRVYKQSFLSKLNVI